MPSLRGAFCWKIDIHAVILGNAILLLASIAPAVPPDHEPALRPTHNLPRTNTCHMEAVPISAISPIIEGSQIGFVLVLIFSSAFHSFGIDIEVQIDVPDIGFLCFSPLRMLPFMKLSSAFRSCLSSLSMPCLFSIAFL